MRKHILAVALVLCGASLFAFTRAPGPAEQQMVAAEIDMMALQAQANGALQKLRELRDQRQAMSSNESF